MFEENAICKMLGLKYPIFQGGMAWLGTAELASAVSEAGGLGIIGAGHMPPDVLRAEIQKVKKATKKPFGVNIMLMSPFVKEVMQLMLDERVPVVTTGAGNPGEYIPSLKEIGTKVIPVVASVALAKRLVRTGVDAVIAEGMESGGHIGELTTMALVPQVVDAVDVPVIAAGGVYRPRELQESRIEGSRPFHGCYGTFHRSSDPGTAEQAHAHLSRERGGGRVCRRTGKIESGHASHGVAGRRRGNGLGHDRADFGHDERYQAGARDPGGSRQRRCGGGRERA